MKILRFVSSILRVERKPSHLLNFTSSSKTGGIRSLSNSSSVSLEASDVELSYTSYPTNNELTDAKQIPILFLHGLFGAKGNLHSVSKHLSSGGRRVITYDARNHGNSGHVDQMDVPSMAQDLSDLINELKMKEPAVLGHSMGGKAAMVHALQQPESVSCIIVADVFPGRSPGISNLIRFAEAMKNADIPQQAGIIKARKSVQVQMAPSVPDRDVLNFLLTNLVESKDGLIHWRVNLDSFLNDPDAIADFPSTTFQPFNKPTLFVFGANSIHYQDADQGRIKELFPSVQIEAIPGAGHFLHAEKPIEFVNIVQDFLKSVESGK